MRKAFVTLVLVLLLTPIPASDAQVLSVVGGFLPDLDITAIQLDRPGGPERIDGSAQNVNVSVVVANIAEFASSNGFVITYQWRPAGGSTQYLTGDLEGSSDVYEGPIGPTDTITTEPFYWALQDGQTGLGDLRITIVPLDADADDDNHVESRRIHIDDHQVGITIEQQDVDLLPGEQTFLRYTVRNDGNVPETVSLQLANGTNPPPARLAAFLSDSGFTVSPGATRTGSLFVQDTGDFSPVNGYQGQYLVTMNTAPDYGSVFTAQTGNIRDTTDNVPPGYDFTVLRSPGTGADTLYGSPGDMIQAEYTLTNTGSYRDIYRISAVSSWDAALSRTDIDLLPSGSATFHVDIEVPQGEPGTPSFTIVQVAAEHVFDAPTINVVDARISGPSVQVDAIRLQEEPIYYGDIVDVGVVISNLGDQDSGPSGRLELGVLGRAIDHTEPMGPVLAGEEGQSVHLPIGPMHLEGAFDLVAYWNESADRTPSLAPVTQGFVRHPDVRLDAPAPLAGAPGAEVSYTSTSHSFQLENTGNADETYALWVEAGNGTASLVVPDSIALAPGETRSIPARHVIPTDPSGPDSLTLHVNISSRPEWTWNATVSTTLLPPPAPQVVLTESLPEHWPREDAFPVTVRVESSTDIVSVQAILEGPEHNDTFTMAPDGSDHSTNLTFVEAGPHTLSFRAVDDFGTVNVTEEWTFVVDPADPPQLSWDAPEDGEEVAQNHTITVQVSEPGAVKEANLTIEDANGTAVVNKSLVFKGGNASFNLSDLEPGDHTIKVHVTNTLGESADLETGLTVLPPSKEDEESLVDDSGERGAPAPIGVTAVAALAALLRRFRWRSGHAMTNAGPAMTTNGFHKRRIRHPMEAVVRCVAGFFRRFRSQKVLDARSGRVRLVPPRAPSRGFLLVALLVAPMVLGAIGGGAGWLAGDRVDHEGMDTEALRTLPPMLQPVLQDDFTVPGAPATVAEAVDALPTGTFTRSPVPDAPEGKAPLMAALSFYSSAMGLDVPGQRTLAEIQSLGLTSDAEEALAVLVLSFVEAVRLHEEAVADLTPEEIAFVLGDATALDDMLGSVDSRLVADAYDARIADIASRVDISKNLQAADLLARAIEQSKDVLADLPPTTVDGAVSTAEDAPRTLHDLDAWEITQALFLDLGAIHSVPVNGPVDLGDAMQDLAAVYGIRIPEVSIDGLDSDVEAAIARIALAHAKGSQTDAQSHSSAVLDAIQAATPILQDWADSFSDGLPAVPTMTTSAAIQTSDECLPTDDPSLGAVDPSTLAPSIDPDITGGGVLLDVPLPSFAPDCKPNPSLLTITGIGGATISTEAILHIDLGGDDTYEGVVAGPGTVHVQASPVGVEPIVESRSIGAIHLDLGGDDDYITPDLDRTQGSAMQGFSVLFDVDGSDEYQAGRFSQGAVCCTPPPSQSVSEPDAYMGVGGIGLLMDLGGNDQYTSTNNSQAYAEAGLYAFSDGSAGPEEDSPGFGGFLVDADGDDVYAFGTQASAVAGTASVAVQNQALSAAGARTVAALVDMDGDDVYRSIDRPIDPTNPSQWFLTQALAENDADDEYPDGSNVRSASAAFIDLRGDDTYLERSLEEVGGQMVQVDKESRAAPQKLRVNGALTNVEQYGEHELFLDVPPPLPDQDGDGAPDAVEVEAGTDPTDPGSHPGAVFGSGGEPDLEYILRAPSPGQGILAGAPSGGILDSIPSGLRVPGLVIAGAEANVHTDDAVFVVDLGGDDTYQNPAVGGIRVASGDDGSDYDATPTGGVGENRVTPRVALLLDVGPGNDTYAPTTVVVPSPPVRGDLFSIRNQPSLGGASLGVAVAADAGGSNAFNSSISISAIVNESLPIVDEEQNRDNQFQATAIAHGITQGAGYAGGVGVLLLWDGQNDLSARSDAFAGEFGRLASGVDRPVARSFTVAQGAGLQRGTGILLNLGDGDDLYDATATAYAQGDDGASSEDRRVALAVSQGAGLGGYGFLVDRGGDNRFAANTPLAQGAANQYYEVFESINERPEQLEVQLQLREDPGMPPAVGFLWSGVGDDVYNGTVLVQGAATAELPWQPWNEEDGVFFEHREGYDDTPGATGPLSNSRNVAREGTAVAALVDVGGNDRYMARPPQSLLVESAFAQGAAGFHAVALLLDGSGDDTYHAQDGVAFVQGAGRFGDALLADLSGHDEYIATGQAQGYATDALTHAVRIRRCTGSTTTALTGGAEFVQCPYKTFLAPASTAEFSIWPGRGYELGTWQQNVVVMHMPPSTGMLVDLSGNDQYIATGNAQGAIHNDPRVVAMAGSCQPGLHGIERNFGNNLLFRDYRWEVFPAVHSCPDPGFPDAPHPDFGIDRRPWVERDTSAGPPMTSPVLGLLMDLEGMDAYDYPNAAFKVPLDDPQRAVPKDANDWAWNQTVSGGANADDTMLPQDTFRGDTGSQLPERDIVTNDIMGPVPAWIRPFQEQWGPDGYEILLGHDATMDLLLSQLEDSSGVNGLPRPEATAPLLDFTFEPVVFEVKDGNATVSPGRLHVQGTNGVSFTTNITDPAGVNDNVPDQIHADCPIIEAAPACNAANDAAADHLNEHVPTDPVPFRGSPATFDGVSSGNMTFDLGNITLGRDHITVATIGVDVEDWTIRGPDGTEQSVGADDLVMPQNTSIPFSGVLTLPDEIGPMTVPDGTRNLTFLPVVRVEILNITNEGALAAFSLWPLQITADPEPLDDGSRYLPSYEYSHLLPARGVGIDDDNITEAMRLLFDRTHGKDTSVPEPAQVGVELQILDAQGMLVEDGDTTSDELSLYANVRMPAGQEQEIDRVVFQSNSQRIGRGQEVDPLNNQTGVRSFRFNWTTDQLDATGDVVYQDADYRLVTSVFLESGGIEPIRVESAVRPIRVDNPPQVFLELDAHRLDSGLAVVSPTAEGQDAALRIRITSDAAFPGNHTPSSEDSLPRGYLEVTAHDGPEDHVVFPEQYVDEQMTVVPITALCGDQACLEGIYTLNATVRDTGGLTDHANRTILYDATAPRSWIDMPLYANQVHQKQSGTTDGVRIHWDFTDLHGATPDVSGTREVQIYRLLDDRVERLDFGTSKSTVIRGVAVGDEIRLVPVAVDHIGNAEASCRPGTDTRPDDQGQNVDPLCYQSKAEASDGVTTVLVDYLPPSIDDVKATPEYIIPGETPLKITAISADQPQGSGLHSVFVRFDELVVPLQPDMESNKLDQWSQTDWNGTPNPFQPLGQERRFNYVVTAVDHADNRRTGTIKTLYLDDLDPRVQVTSIEYPSDEGDFAAGRSGGKVEISIHAEDLALQSATIDFSSITQNPQDTARSCPILTAGEDQEGQFADYVCGTTIPSPSITGSGDYVVPVKVADKAGNQAVVDVPIKVSNDALEMSEWRVMDVDHQGATVAWNTSEPGTSQVFWATTVDALESGNRRATALHDDATTQHRVALTDLEPNKDYVVEAESLTFSGIPNATGRMFFRTDSALDITFPGIGPGTILSEDHIDLHVGFLSGTDPADIQVSVVASGCDSCVRELVRLQGVAGDIEVPIDRSGFGDGQYLVRVVADRLGDHRVFLSEPFTIDNVAPFVVPWDPLPGRAVTSTQPVLVWRVLDTGTDLPSLDTLHVEVDGQEVDTREVEYRSGSGGLDGDPADGAWIDIPVQRTPTGDVIRLEDGETHHAQVRLMDAAGNVATATLDFVVDVSAPRFREAPTIQYHPGPIAGRPTGTVDLSVVLDDPAGVAGAQVTFDAWGLDVPLVPEHRAWHGTFAIPSDVDPGIHAVPVTTEDRLGNQEVVGHLDILVDTTAPTIESHNASVDHNVVDLQVKSDEPTAIQVTSGTATWERATFADNHSLRVGPLMPGTEVSLSINASDGAGNVRSFNITVTTEPDEGAPGPVSGLNATVREDGTVLLQWTASMDDSGIASYRVSRLLGGGVNATWESKGISNTDASPPIGRSLTYQVVPVDLVGNLGPARSVSVFIDPAPPILTNLSVTPDQGGPSTLFTFHVTYIHEFPAVGVVLEVAGSTTPMDLLDSNATSCRQGCTYSAATPLATTDMDSLATKVRIVATSTNGGTNAEMDRPLVWGDDGALSMVDEEPKEAPAGALWPAIILIIFVASRRRYR